METDATETKIRIGDQAVQLYIQDGCNVDTIELPDLDDEYWFDRADDSITNGPDTIYRWDLGNNLSLYVDYVGGYPEFAQVSAKNIDDVLRDWYDAASGDGIEEAEYREGWGRSGLDVLNEADEDWTGRCRVWVEPHYYAGTYNAPVGRFARDDQDNIIEFASYAAAAAYVDHYYNAPSAYDGIPQCNVLSHGQAGSDTLTIVQA